MVRVAVQVAGGPAAAATPAASRMAARPSQRARPRRTRCFMAILLECGLLRGASAAEAVEGAEIGRQRRGEGLEGIDLARVEARLRRGGLIGEGGQGGDRLGDVGPAERALVAVVVGRVDAL